MIPPSISNESGRIVLRAPSCDCENCQRVHAEIDTTKETDDPIVELWVDDKMIEIPVLSLGSVAEITGRLFDLYAITLKESLEDDEEAEDEDGFEELPFQLGSMGEA